MKKIIFFITLAFISILASCKKKEELSFSNGKIEAKSYFSDTSFSFELDKISQQKDGDIYYDYFYSPYTYDEIKEILNDNQYYVCEKNKMIRFCKDGSYFCFSEVEKLDGYAEYILSSERVPLLINGKHFLIEFPTDLVDKVYNYEYMTIPSSNKEYILDYYFKIKNDNVIVKDDIITITSIKNRIDKDEKLYKLIISFDDEKVKVEVE